MAQFPLFIPTLIDTTSGEVHEIEIIVSKHKFSHDGGMSGSKKDPIFGCIVNGKTQSFGLPTIRLKRGTTPHLRFINKTGYTFDLHWHGLNVDAGTDGASMEVEFGKGTKIGEVLDLQFPEIFNNSACIWMHAHNMGVTTTMVYRGLYGMVQIVDEESKFMDEYFAYGNNHLTLAYRDADFNSEGALEMKAVYTGGGRSCFGVINGQSCVNWYSNDEVKYVSHLYHYSTRNLMKIDIVNGTASFRYIYVGICDKKDRIRTFQLIQSDQGLINPTPLKMASICHGSRISILFDLEDYEDDAVYVFLYNYDLTQFDDLPPAESTGPVGDNPTPTPVPITDPPTGRSILNYPLVSSISRGPVKVENGNVVPGDNFTIKKFLAIGLTKKNKQKSLSKIIKKIRKCVFGENNYAMYREILDQPFFEYNSALNYLSLLNKNYYYNIPDFDKAASRHFLLFPDGDENKSATTELIEGAHRIFFDMWNSDELDINYAISEYIKNNNYKPKLLPTCLFKIFPSENEFMNYEMLSNDKLTIEFFKDKITYSDEKTLPLGSVDIVFPKNEIGMNIQQWVDLVNTTFEKTFFRGTSLKSILTFDWNFYPYKSSYISDKVIYIKSVAVKLVNKSDYSLRFKGKYNLLHFFGKAVSAGIPPPGVKGPHMGGHMNHNNMGNINSEVKTEEPTAYTGCVDCICGEDCSCDETHKCSGSCSCYMMPMNHGTMGLRKAFVEYATENPQETISSFDDMCLLIINNKSTYSGFLDGVHSCNFMSFSTQLESTEKWIYHNMDDGTVHPFHFHLTSGFVNTRDEDNSKGLIRESRAYDSMLYSKDLYPVPSQESLGYYLKFTNYSSEDGKIKGLPFAYHCHIDYHHDVGMMGLYYTYKNRSDYF